MAEYDDQSADTDSQQTGVDSMDAESPIRILALAADVKRYKNVVPFLERRHVHIQLATDLRQLIQTVLTNRPDFLIFSAEFPNPQVKSMPIIFSQTFNMECILLGETADFKTNSVLSQSKAKNIIYGPVSGPAIYSRLKSIIKERELQAQMESAGQGYGASGARSNSPGEEDNAIVLKGGTQSNAEAMEKLMRSLSGNAQEPDKLQSSSNINQSKDENHNQVQNTSSSSAVNGQGIGALGNNNGPKASDVVLGSSKGSQPQNSSQFKKGENSDGSTANQHHSSKDSTNSDAMSFGKGKSATDLGNYLDKGRRSKMNQATQEGVDAKGFNERQEQEKKGSSFLQTQQGPNQNKHSFTEPSGLNPTSQSSSSSALPQVGSSSNTLPLNTRSGNGSGTFGDGSKEGSGETNGTKDKKNDGSLGGAYSPDQGTSGTSGRGNSPQNSSGAGGRDRDKNGHARDNKRRKKILASKRSQLKDSDAKGIELFKDCAEQAMKSLSQPIHGSGADFEGRTFNVGLIPINSSRFKGYLLVACSQDRFLDESFLATFRNLLVKEMNRRGEFIRADDILNVETRGVVFSDFINDVGEFQVIGATDGTDVLLGFIHRVSNLPIIRRSTFSENMSLVDVRDVPTGVPLDFEAYLYLPVNKRYLKYLKKGSELTDAQLDKLIESKMDQLHIPIEFEANFKRDYVKNVINEEFKVHDNSYEEDASTSPTNDTKSKKAS